eukprot:scaffold46749_cov69-Phaeocystis_antarctica.AAC.1
MKGKLGRVARLAVCPRYTIPFERTGAADGLLSAEPHSPGWFHGCGLGAARVFLSALKPSRRVLDSTHLGHTATQHWVDRHAHAPYVPVPVPNSSPPRTEARWAEWHLDRSRSSKERVEASPAR